ncbi:HLA class II histocompatibility antigen, DM alpha chain isoform X1 [Microcaecilia unicolor]|uniref:HLA class II histocompatibility antigen, DM alpha chain isoform X1 n=1 Tax=Microcaecilia unicolor TaxID=1415580 RepID=A0A6P7XR21_9AMPH|nr:HLA class II histocompatibility antigen, DM alpha chain isoform X1 [Microcaecilia unicolor]
MSSMGVHSASLCLAVTLLHLLQKSGSENVISQVLYCQPGHPQVGLVDTFEDDEMFHYDFHSEAGVARLPVFRQLAGDAYNASTISHDASLCQKIREVVTKALELIMPESKGIPKARVYTRSPLQLGKPNTLICYVSNFFPPTLNITWTKNSDLVWSGVNTTNAYPTHDLGFYMFSYLDIIPASDDIYGCHVAQEGEVYTTITYWVPKNAIPSDLLETVLCAVAFGIGAVCLILGIVLIVKARRPQYTGI